MTAIRSLVGVTVFGVILSWLLMPTPSFGQGEDRKAKAGDWVQYEEIFHSMRFDLNPSSERPGRIV